MPTISASSEAADLISTIVAGNVQDPFPYYNQLRELDPGMHYSEMLGAWICSRYDDIKAQCNESERFSNSWFFQSPTGMHDPAVDEHLRYIAISSQQFMFMDSPEHTAVRSIFRNAFSPRTLAKWRPRIERVTDELLADFEPGQEVDVMVRLAIEVPVRVIAAMLGVPSSDTTQFRKWTQSFVDTFNPQVENELRDQAIRGSLELFDYLSVLIECKKAEPQDDLITLIATTPTGDGKTLDHRSAIAQSALLLTAGNETTTNLIGNSITKLIEYPDVKNRLLKDRTLIPAAIEEVLRLDPPFHIDFTKATRDTMFGGQQIQAGQMIFQLIGAANRDPRHFERADEFDLDRKNNRHLSFSHGIHFCLGAPLARMEAEVVLNRLLDKFPTFTAGRVPATRRADTIITRGWKSRPVRL